MCVGLCVLCQGEIPLLRCRSNALVRRFQSQTASGIAAVVGKLMVFESPRRAHTQRPVSGRMIPTGIDNECESVTRRRHVGIYSPASDLGINLRHSQRWQVACETVPCRQYLERRKQIKTSLVVLPSLLVRNIHDTISIVDMM